MGFMLSKVTPLLKKKDENYELQVLKEHDAGVNVLAMNDEETVLATGGDDNAVKLWSVSDDVETECLALLDGHTGYVNCLTFDDIYLLSGSADKSIRKWNITSFKCDLIFQSHKSVVNRLIVSGDYLFSSSYDQTAIKWDFNTGECLTVYAAHKLGVYPLAFIPGGTNRSTDHHYNDGNKYDDDSDDRAAKKSTYRIDNEVKRKKYRGDILVTGSSDHTAIMWKVGTGKVLFRLEGHSGGITCLALDDAAKNIFTGSMDKTIRCWSVDDGEMIRLFEGHSNSVICMIVKGKLMYSGSSDRTGKSWIIEFGDSTRTYHGHEHTVTCIKYDDGTVFTGCGDGVIRCFDSKAGTLKRTLAGHTLAVNSILIKGEKLFSGSNDGTLRVWDISDMTDETAFASEQKPKKKVEKTAKATSNSDHRQQHVAQTSNKFRNNNKITIEDDF